MTVESGKYIGSMNPDYPEVDDPVAEGDDHLRGIKQKLIDTLPGKDGNGFAKPIVATEDELNFVKGVTGPIQTQFNELPTKFVGKVGGQSIDGRLTIDERLTIIVDGADSTDGVSIVGTDGNLRGSLNYSESGEHVSVKQQGSGVAGGPPDTALFLKGGEAILVADNGFTGDPVDKHALVTLEYFEANTIGVGDTVIDGSLTIHDELKIIADGGPHHDGMSIYAPDPADNDTLKLRAAWFWNEDDNRMEQALVANDDTVHVHLILFPDGAMTINGDVVLTTGNTAKIHAALATSGGVSGTFEDNSGKTVTVTDGLITDLG